MEEQQKKYIPIVSVVNWQIQEYVLHLIYAIHQFKLMICG